MKIIEAQNNCLYHFPGEVKKILIVGLEISTKERV